MNGRISRTTLEELRLRASIVDVVSEYVELRRAGSSLRGLCPFHREKTPSFFVSSEKGVFHCFGCGAGGDFISFVMQYKKVDYREAVEELCERTGVEVVYEGGAGEADALKRLFDVNRFGADYYHKVLFQKGNPARTYLKKRGIEEDTARSLTIGYGGDGRRGLAREMKVEGLDVEAAIECGLLFRRKNGEVVDRFSGRLIFPIITTAGKIAGFAGRSLDDSEPKYINSSESRIYKKKNLLYGLNFSGKFVREESRVYVVEGYMDWIIMWQAGIKNVVATCGTAMTSNHFRALKKVTDKVILLFDGDMAGRKAAVRSMEPAYEAGISPLVFFPPKKRDPDDWIREAGVESVKDALGGAKLLMEYIIDAAAKKFDLNSISQRLDYLKLVGKYLKNVRDPVEKEMFVQEIAAKLNLTADDIRKWTAKQEGDVMTAPVIDSAEKALKIKPEEAMVGFLLKHPRFAARDDVKMAISAIEDAELAEIASKLTTEPDESGTILESSTNREGEKLASRLSKAVLLYEQFFPEAKEEDLEKILGFIELRRKEDELAKIISAFKEEGDSAKREEMLRLQMKLKKDIEETRKNL